MRKIKLKTGKIAWQADVILANGRRVRPQFQTKEECAKFEREAKLRVLVGALPEAEKPGTPTYVAIGKYIKTISVKKDSHSGERLYFKVLLEGLNDPKVIGADISTIDQVRLIQLQSLQTFLSTQPTHMNCFKYVRRNDEARAKELKEKAGAIQAEDGTAADALLRERDEILSRWTLLSPSKMCREKPEECRAQVLAASTVNRYFNSYLDFFNRCVDWGYFGDESSPITRLEKLPESPEVKQIHSHETTEKVIAGLEEQRDEWAADALIGVDELIERPSTIARIEWRHVDFRRRMIVLTTKKGKKGGLRHREVPFSDRLLERLSGMHDRARRAFRARPEDLVFTSKTGQKLCSQTLAKAVRVACSRLGIAGYTAYCERHGGVTELRRMGVDIGTIADLVGHTNLNTTRHDYSHLESEDYREVVERLSKSKKKTERRSGS